MLAAGVILTVMPLVGLFVYSEGSARRTLAVDRSTSSAHLDGMAGDDTFVERANDDGLSADDLAIALSLGQEHTTLGSNSGHPPRIKASSTSGRVKVSPTSSAPPPQIHPKSYHGPRKLLLVCLYTGGVSPVAIKEKSGQDGHATNEARVNSRVDAQLESWADDIDVFYVTHANISSPRVIKLPKEAESGGYKGIWLKTLHLFDHLAFSDFGQQYDFVFKGDDDTLVNLPELRHLLRQLDPALPFQLGNNGYGVGCRGPAPTSLYYRQNRGTDPCHGGAGYVLSRGLLDLVAPKFKGCANEWPMSSYEDAKLSYCLMHHAAVNCMGMKQDFGWDRYHNPKRAMVPAKLKALENTPVMFAMGVSFHPVPADFQHIIHTRLRELGRKHHGEIALKRREVMGKSHRYMVTQWNCTVATAAPVQTRGPAALNALCQQYIARNPPLLAERSAVGIFIAETEVERVGEVKSFELEMLGRAGGSNAVVFVSLAQLWGDAPSGESVSNSREVGLCIGTLRATGCSAVVVLLATSVQQFEMAQNVVKQGKGAVEVFHVRSQKGSLRAVIPAAVVRLLRSNPGRFESVLVCSVATIFQLDPFKSIPLRGGLAAFVTETFPANLTTHKPSGWLVMSHMGVCSTRDERASANDFTGGNSFRGPGLVDAGVIIGMAAAVEVTITTVQAHECWCVFAHRAAAS
jgi:hypothetical protein